MEMEMGMQMEGGEEVLLLVLVLALMLARRIARRRALLEVLETKARMSRKMALPFPA